MNRRQSVITDTIQFLLTVIAFVIFLYGGTVYYTTSSQYTFTSVSLATTDIPCYANLTFDQSSRTKVFSLDYFLITSLPFVIALIAATTAAYGNALNNITIVILSCVVLLILGVYSIGLSITYAIAAAYCADFWYCIQPCISNLNTSGTPTIEFRIAQVSHIINIFLCALGIIIAIAASSITRAGSNITSIMAQYGLVDSDDDDDDDDN